MLIEDQIDYNILQTQLTIYQTYGQTILKSHLHIEVPHLKQH